MKNNNTSKYNVLWLFIDGVRRYHSTTEAIAAGDDRSRLKFMDKFAKDAVEFTNVVTSAPTTFMSLSSMVSGMPAYFINRNYDDFIFAKEQIPSLSGDLERNNYNIYSFLMHPSTREKMINIFPMIKKRYWPKGFSHRNWWSNDDINSAVEKTLSMGVERPAFFFVGYNCRLDFEMSDKVKWAYKKFYEAGFTPDNTITILCSDHGYPDPSKETGRPEFYKKHNLSHDLVLTDDNIMIPFFIHYPSCKKGKKIETTVSSIDLYPTIMELAGFKLSDNEKLHGKSWVPIINGDKAYIKMMEQRFHRCDNRFAFQNGKGTVIRNGYYKYINYHGENLAGGETEEFFDLLKDPLETNNLIYSNEKSIIGELYEFRNLFNESENNAFEYQVEYLVGKIIRRKGGAIKIANSILLIDSANPLFIRMLIEMVKRINPKINISLLRVEHDFDFKDINIIESNYKSWHVEIIKDRNIIDKIRLLCPDIIIIPFNTSEGRDNKSLKKFIKRLPAKEKIYLDYNLGYYNRTLLNYYWKKFKPMWHFAKQEPLYIFNFIYSNLSKYISLKITKEKWDIIE